MQSGYAWDVLFKDIFGTAVRVKIGFETELLNMMLNELNALEYVVVSHYYGLFGAQRLGTERMSFDQISQIKGLYKDVPTPKMAEHILMLALIKMGTKENYNRLDNEGWFVHLQEPNDIPF